MIRTSSSISTTTTTLSCSTLANSTQCSLFPHSLWQHIFSSLFKDEPISAYARPTSLTVEPTNTTPPLIECRQDLVKLSSSRNILVDRFQRLPGPKLQAARSDLANARRFFPAAAHRLSLSMSMAYCCNKSMLATHRAEWSLRCVIAWLNVDGRG